MGRKILLAVVWFPLSGILLVTLLVNLVFLSRSQQSAVAQTAGPKENDAPLHDFRINTNVAAGQTAQVLSATVTAGDGRAYLLEDFLNEHTSPLAPFSEALVTEADVNHIDYRMVAAIAMCESNLGKRIPGGSFNAWGIAVYSGENSGATFQSWSEAIVWVSRYIREQYAEKGLTNLKDMSAKWAPPSVNTDYSWAACVDSFMKDIVDIP